MSIEIVPTTQKSYTSTTFSAEGNINVFSYSASPCIYDRSIFVMAKAFLSISEMSHKKLQKLCYYAKAWYLALYDCNIVFEQFEAWVHGAVQPDLYQFYKKYGFSTIPKENGISSIAEEYMSFAREIYASYGHLTGDDLEALNHSEMPWIKARNGMKPWENCTNIISEADMKHFYRMMIDGQ